MERDWRPEIVQMAMIKQAIHAADSAGLWEYHYPRVAATPEKLTLAEEGLGFRLEPGYRGFLGYGDGWPSFYQNVDLFGIDDLLGSPRMIMARELLSFLEPVALDQAGLLDATLVPIAATTEDIDLFVMTVVDGVLQPPVVWFAGSEIDRFETFGDYVLSMIELNRRGLPSLGGLDPALP